MRKSYKPYRYWKDINNIISELEAVQKRLKIDYIPSSPEINRVNPNLYFNISKYFWGIKKLREIIKKEYPEKYIPKLSHYSKQQKFENSIRFLSNSEIDLKYSNNNGQKDILETLEEIISLLDERGKTIIEMRLDRTTFETIGRAFGVTKQNAHRIYDNRIKKLMQNTKARKLYQELY